MNSGLRTLWIRACPTVRGARRALPGEDTLSRQLQTRQLPATPVPIGYCARKRRFSYGPPFHIEQSSMRPHVALFHNHPSGIAEPSQADEFITRRLKDALACVDVRVHDHLIVGENMFSFAEAGLL
jgi:hypothetical protein